MNIENYMLVALAVVLTALAWLIKTFPARSPGCVREMPSVHWILGPEQPTQPDKENKDMLVNITKGFRRKLTAAPFRRDPTTGQNVPASLDGALQARVITGEATAQPVEGDPLSIYINGTGAVGSSVIEAYADARLGPEVREIVLRLEVEVRDPEAENLGLNLGDEEPIPAPAPAPEAAVV